MRGKSPLHDLAKLMCQGDVGKHQGRYDEFLEGLKRVAEQHRLSKKGQASLLIKFIKHCGHKPKRAKVT